MSKPEKIYILLAGRMYNDVTVVVGAARTKKKAAKMCRDKGYKWSSEDQLFCNVEEGYWIRVEVLTVGEQDSYSRDVSYGRNKRQRQEEDLCYEQHGFRQFGP